jgi:hypothetical protein
MQACESPAKIKKKYILKQYWATFGHEDPIKRKTFVGNIINDFYAFYLCVLKTNTLSSVLPTLGR